MNEKIAKLKRVEAELLKLLAQLEEPVVDKPIKRQARQMMVYQNGLDFLIDKDKVKALLRDDVRIEKSGVSDSTKTLIQGNIKSTNSKLLTLKYKTIEKISALNGDREFVPEKDAVNVLIMGLFEEAITHIAQGLTSDIELLFAQGRKHQGLVKGSIDVMKYLQKDEDITDWINNHYNNVFNFLQENVYTASTVQEIDEIYKKANDKSALVKYFSKFIKKQEKDILDIYEHIAFWTYSVGNIYQLHKESTQYVFLNSSHCLQDCIGCRRIERGDALLVHPLHTIRYLAVNEKKAYLLEDILGIIVREGMSVLCHQGCRCNFIKAL